WSLASGALGTISSTGLYRASISGTGTDIVKATYSLLTGSQKVYIGVPSASPSNLIATASSTTQVTLSWTDNSNNEQGFIVQRSTDGGQTWSNVRTLGANVTTHVDKTVTAGRTYAYRVEAFNALGDSGSNIAVASVSPAVVASSPGVYAAPAVVKAR